MTEPARHPVLVLSSNRPQELAELLQSLMRQDGARTDKRPVFLFQDGGRSRSGGQVRWSDAVLLENLDLFRRIVPHGVPLPSYHHLGADLNRDRAERFAFEEMGAEAAVLLRDDLMPGRRYLRTTDDLIALALTNGRIGEVSADGDHRRATTLHKKGGALNLVGLSRPRGVGMVRAQWLRTRPYVSAYLDLAGDRARIVALFRGWGMEASDTSYEAAVAHASVLAGAARLGTAACFARYLTEPGQAHVVWADGFGGPPLIEEDCGHPEMPDTADLMSLIAAAAGHGGTMPGGRAG